MKKKGIGKRLIWRIRELLDEANVKIQIGDEVIDDFLIEKGVRQNCPLSPNLFNVAVAELDEEMAEVQGSAIKIGKKVAIDLLRRRYSAIG